MAAAQPLRPSMISGKTPQQQGADQSAAWNTPKQGQAQPQQSPWATSTPYGQQGSKPYAAWGAGQTINQGMNPQQQNQAFTAWTMPKQDLLQWGQSLPQNQWLTPQQGMSPEQSWGAISGVINQVNNQAAGQQVGTYLGQGAPPAGWGQTSYDPQQLWSQANQMVQQGWQNPFVQQSGFQQPQDPGAAIRGLLQGYNIPQSVLDNIGAMLGPSPRPSGTTDLPGRQPPPSLSDGSGFTAPGGPAGGMASQPRIDGYLVNQSPNYATYMAQRSRRHGGQPPLSEQEFRSQRSQYLDSLGLSADDLAFHKATMDFRNARGTRGYAEEDQKLLRSLPALGAGKKSPPAPKQQAKAPTATEQWQKIAATTNTQTRPLTPDQRRIYDAMVAEKWAAAGAGTAWQRSGSPLADVARAKNAKAGSGLTGMR